MQQRNCHSYTSNASFCYEFYIFAEIFTHKMKKQIPNFITLINLFCGCLAIVFMFEGNYYGMFVCVLTAEFADLLDGLAARWLNAYSEIGKNLDSLADMVTFGVLPGIGMYQMLMMSGIDRTIAYSGFLLTLVSCYRLANFNAHESSDDFHGLATPSTTAFTLGLLLTAHYNTFGLRDFILNPVFLYFITGLFSFLMLSNYPMFSLRFKGANWKGNELRYTFIILGISSIFFLQWASLPFGIGLYIVMAIFLTRRV